MSTENKPIKITLEDSQRFYNEVYKQNSDQLLESMAPEIQRSIKDNSLALRQFQYHQLANDFLNISKDRGLRSEEVLKFLNTSSESWKIWHESRNLGAGKREHVTPVTFNNDTIMKMSAMVLKDTLSKYMVNNNISEISKDDMNNVIDFSKITVATKGSILQVEIKQEVVDKNKNGMKIKQ